MIDIIAGDLQRVICCLAWPNWTRGLPFQQRFDPISHLVQQLFVFECAKELQELCSGTQARFRSATKKQINELSVSSIVNLC